MNRLVHQIVALGMGQRVAAMERMMRAPLEAQQAVWASLMQRGRSSAWGKHHDFASIANIAQYQQRIPISSYEQLYPWIERALNGDEGVLWPGRPAWFAKSSGTTNDRSKFIPITPENLQNCHYKAGKDLMAMYLDANRNANLFSGKALSIGGSHEISRWNGGSRYGDLSAILIENMPRFFELFRAPSKQVALMSKWEEKLEAMAQEVIKENITCIYGVPTWTVVLIHRLMELKGTDNLADVWPNLEVFFHGAVAFGPYRQQFAQLVRSPSMHYMESYNASEGFFAIQHELDKYDMLLLCNHDIFYEFIPMDQLDSPEPKAVWLADVELDRNYALVISTSSGLWRYLIGDTVRFTSKNPYKLVISGRTRQFINAFGEELVVENAEAAILAACQATHAQVRDYSAGPIYFQGQEAGGHEWVIEFSTPPDNFQRFCHTMDDKLRQLNSDYDAKRHGDMALSFPKVHLAPEGTFYQWMKQRGKLGGQHKVPRLSNSREYLETLLPLLHA